MKYHKYFTQAKGASWHSLTHGYPLQDQISTPWDGSPWIKTSCHEWQKLSASAFLKKLKICLGCFMSFCSWLICFSWCFLCFFLMVFTYVFWWCPRVFSEVSVPRHRDPLRTCRSDTFVGCDPWHTSATSRRFSIGRRISLHTSWTQLIRIIEKNRRRCYKKRSTMMPPFDTIWGSNLGGGGQGLGGTWGGDGRRWNSLSSITSKSLEFEIYIVQHMCCVSKRVLKSRFKMSIIPRSKTNPFPEKNWGTADASFIIPE